MENILPAATMFSSTDTTPTTALVPNSGIDASDNVPPMSLDCGSLELNGLSAPNYVGSPHWAAVLCSIADLKDHLEHEKEKPKVATDTDAPNSVHSRWPQLLYGYPTVTEAEILSSIPPRQVVDSLVWLLHSRYRT